MLVWEQVSLGAQGPRLSQAAVWQMTGWSGVCVHVCIFRSMSQKSRWMICDLVEAIIATRVKWIRGKIVKKWEGLREKSALQVWERESTGPHICMICRCTQKFIEEACMWQCDDRWVSFNTLAYCTVSVQDIDLHPHTPAGLLKLIHT